MTSKAEDLSIFLHFSNWNRFGDDVYGFRCLTICQHIHTINGRQRFSHADSGDNTRARRFTEDCYKYLWIMNTDHSGIVSSVWNVDALALVWLLSMPASIRFIWNGSSHSAFGISFLHFVLRLLRVSVNIRRRGFSTSTVATISSSEFNACHLFLWFVFILLTWQRVSYRKINETSE